MAWVFTENLGALTLPEVWCVCVCVDLVCVKEVLR